MGKSLKNGVSPEEMYRRYGADTLRLYEMAMGPLEVDKPWRTDDVVGVHRFLQRLWRCLVDEQTGTLTVSDEGLDASTEQALHATIASVRHDLGLLRFNTAIARLMELVTIATRISATTDALPRALAEPLVLMTAPLAPHIAEELWARLGHPDSLAYATFPMADRALAATPFVTLPVQVNGRTRFRIEVPTGSAENDIEQAVRAHPDYSHYAAAATIERMVVVPDRIVNMIIRSPAGCSHSGPGRQPECSEGEATSGEAGFPATALRSDRRLCLGVPRYRPGPRESQRFPEDPVEARQRAPGGGGGQPRLAGSGGGGH